MTLITNGAGHGPLDFKRNQACALDLGWINQLRVNRAAADRRAASLANRRSVKKEYQAAWLLKAIECIDLTTLGGDDTPGRVERLCLKALRPLRADLMSALGVANLHTGAVCVYHEMIAPAVKALGSSGLPVAAVSTGFPAGLTSMETKVREIELSVAAGATEIDIVITRQHVLTNNWQALYDEMLAYRAACGEAHLKAILATGDLLTLENVARASWVCMMAGADFIKTSTGKEGVNATIPVALTMVRAIREYHEQTGFEVGFKPAGGVSSAKTALGYLMLMKEELDRQWLEPHLFRIGASSLLTDIERQLEHYVTGQYSAAHRHAMP
jgi:deoxyribose-phosphate aldolase